MFFGWKLRLILVTVQVVGLCDLFYAASSCLAAVALCFLIFLDCVHWENLMALFPTIDFRFRMDKKITILQVEET